MSLQDELQSITSRLDGLANICVRIENKLDPSELDRPPMPSWVKLGDLETALSIFIAIRNREKIMAIKHLRTLTGLGLKEAKDCIEIIYDRIIEKEE